MFSNKRVFAAAALLSLTLLVAGCNGDGPTAPSMEPKYTIEVSPSTMEATAPAFGHFLAVVTDARTKQVLADPFITWEVTPTDGILCGRGSSEAERRCTAVAPGTYTLISHYVDGPDTYSGRATFKLN